MHRAVVILCFSAGCALALCSILWLIAAENGSFILPSKPWQGVVMAMIYAAMMLFTLDRPSLDQWPPLFNVSRTRVVVARLALALSVLICAASFLLRPLGRMAGEPRLAENSFFFAIASLGFLNGLYVALHWAFRPRNLFGPNMPNGLTDPLGVVIVPILKIIGVGKHSSELGDSYKKHRRGR